MCYGGGDDGFDVDVSDMNVDIGIGDVGSFDFLADDDGTEVDLTNADDMTIDSNGDVISDGTTFTSNGATIGPGTITMDGPNNSTWTLYGITGSSGSLDFGAGGSWNNSGSWAVGVSIGWKF